MDNILITGGTGFLGSHLIRSLINNYNVSVLIRNESNLIRIKDIVNQIQIINIDKVGLQNCIDIIKPNIIIHCATDYGRKTTDPTQIIDANLILPLKLLYLCDEFKVNAFINTDTYLDKRISDYSLSKKQFRDWLKSYSSKLVCINIILEHFYGPKDDKSKFVSYVIHELLNQSNEINLTLGEQKRDFIYIKDVVDAFEIIIKEVYNKYIGFYEFNIGTGKTIKINELVSKIKEITNNQYTKLNFGAIPYRDNEIMNSDMDISAIKKLGWSPKYKLEEGLQETIEIEIKKNYK